VLCSLLESDHHKHTSMDNSRSYAHTDTMIAHKDSRGQLGNLHKGWLWIGRALKLCSNIMNPTLKDEISTVPIGLKVISHCVLPCCNPSDQFLSPHPQGTYVPLYVVIHPPYRVTLTLLTLAVRARIRLSKTPFRLRLPRHTTLLTACIPSLKPMLMFRPK
jgi:hypothetical protein